MEPDDGWYLLALVFEAKVHTAIERANYAIIANAGDQSPDPAGGDAERSFLLSGLLNRVP